LIEIGHVVLDADKSNRQCLFCNYVSSYSPDWEPQAYGIGAAVALSVYGLGYVLDDQVSIPDRGGEFFSPPPRPNRLWRPPSHPFDGHWGPFPQG